MPESSFHRAGGPGIRTRLVVTGNLIAQTPIHLGNGDGDDLVDLPLLEDPLEGGPLLTGASLAGAMRGYLQARERGERAARRGSDRERPSAVAQLLGGDRGDLDGRASRLIVDDARAHLSGIERRDGVRLDPVTRTAEDQLKFDLELWPAGTTFPLRFELRLEGGPEDEDCRRALATALAGFQDPIAGIRLGARKSRGYGQVTVDRWHLARYDLDTPAGLIAWIGADDEEGARAFPAQLTDGADPATLLGVEPLTDQRRWLALSARFGLDGSLLIRSGTGQDDLGPDSVHLQARSANGLPVPIISGTSLAGALRARAARIVTTLTAPAGASPDLVDTLFGSVPSASKSGDSGVGSPRPATASRLIVDESVIHAARADLVQSRVRIDRFTGGTFPGALFSEQPVFGNGETAVTLHLRLMNPSEPEVGLLLLLLKDLWTGDLPLGGEISVGRGRLRGGEARIGWRQDADTFHEWTISEAGPGRLEIDGDRTALERMIRALREHLRADPAPPPSPRRDGRIDRAPEVV